MRNLQKKERRMAAHVEKGNETNYINWKTFPIHVSGFLDLFGVSMILPLILSHARDIGGSTTMVGVLGSSYGAVQLISCPLMGQWSDLVGRRISLLICLLFSSFSYSLFGFGSTVLMMFIARIPLGIFKHSQSIGKAYLADVTSSDQRSATMGRFSAASSIGFILGPALGGHIVEWSGGFYLVAFLTSALFFLNFVIIWLFVDEVGLSPTEQKTTESSTRATKTLQSNKLIFSPKIIFSGFTQVDWTGLWDLFLIKFLLGLSDLVFKSNFSLMLTQKFNTTPKINGYIISFNSLMSAVVGFCVGWISQRYQSNATLLKHVSSLQILTLLVLSFASSLWIFVLALIPLGAVTTIVRIVCNSLAIQRGHNHEIGTLMGLQKSLLSVARMLGPLIAGMVMEISPSGPGVVGALFACLGVSVIVIRPQDPVIKEKKQN